VIQCWLFKCPILNRTAAHLWINEKSDDTMIRQRCSFLQTTVNSQSDKITAAKPVVWFN